MDQQQTYTQVIDEQTGEIKYVPNNPPQPNPSVGGEQAPQDQNPDSDLPEGEVEAIKESVNSVDMGENDKLTQVLTDLTANNKKLRYDKRLESGKLDGQRLTQYKTSKRLFKKKAIKDKNYQFTFLIDTSGSMLNGYQDGESVSPIQMAIQSVGSTVESLDTLKIRSSIFSMNCAFRLLKGFDKDFNEQEFKADTLQALVGNYQDLDPNGDEFQQNYMSGTSERVAYEQAVEYIDANSTPKTTNVVVILSDGEPGTGTQRTEVIIDGESKFVDTQESSNNSRDLASFWKNRPQYTTIGLGIFRKARQVPNNRQIDDINKLPEVMGDLLTGLML